jgi:serine phosphatase RsbU (regulator of sigma subunit)
LYGGPFGDQHARGRSTEIDTAPILPRQPSPPDRLRVLLVEDDAADAFLVRELLAEVDAPVDLTVAPTLAAAEDLVGAADCVLLDLGLPDAHGLTGLRALVRRRHAAAICVLTGFGDEHLGVQAMGEGAQDYLIKGQVDGTLLARSVRYAVERRRADENARRLREAELRARESARLERGLLPQPLLRTDRAKIHTFYQPGRHSAQLGGDFYDVVQTAPGRIAMMVGDVCGHGVDEAALGVELRVAWRALTLAGVDEDAVLPAIEEVLISERRDEGVFATLAVVTVDLDRTEIEVRLAGHPPPLLVRDGHASVIPAEYGAVLGVFADAQRPTTRVALPAADWSLLLYTDGLIEGRSGDGDGRLDVDGLLQLLTSPPAAALPAVELGSWLVRQAEGRNGGPLADDVAMLLLSTQDGGRG